jgi:hypothetical protein
MNRISLAVRSFFSILFRGTFPADIAVAFGYSKTVPVKAAPPAAPPKPQTSPADGAVQILGILQREARLVDFLMEDISAYSDDQVGAAVRDVQSQSRQALERYMKLEPVIDGVEDTVVKTAGLDADAFKLVGNLPASGTAASGVLRHKGWRAARVDLPAPKPNQTVLVPAEIEVE